MMRQCKFRLALEACLLMLMSAGVSWGQADTSNTGGLIGLEQAMTRTLSLNPLLLAHGFDLPAAEGRLTQAGLRPQPELSVTVEDALGTDSYRGLRSTETTVSLAWILERNVRQHRVDAARAGLSLSAADIEIVRLDVAAETARRFLACLAYQARLQNAAEGVRLAEDAVAAVSNRVAASRAPASELARAEAELVRAELRLEDNEHELLSAYHRLAAQWGDTEPDFEAVAGTVQQSPNIDSFEALVERMDDNPNIARFVSAERLHDAELQLAIAQRRPSWRVSGGLRRIEAGDDFAIVGGVTIPLRLGNSNQGRITEVRAELARTQAEVLAARVNTETELFVLYQELFHNIELAERLDADVAPRFESALADTRRAFELGRSSYLEFRAVQRELLDVTSELLEAHVAAHQLLIEIERLTGRRVLAPTRTQ